MIKPIFTIFASVTLLLLLGACQKNDRQQTLKLAHTLNIDHPVHKALIYMAERLKEKSDGAMAIDIYPSGQLGGERELIELLQIGSLAMTKVSSSPLEEFIDEMKVFSTPYLFEDNDHFWRTLNGDVGRHILLSGESVFLRGLGFYDAGSRSFYSVNKPIHTPDDLAGLKIRVQQSQSAIQMVNTLGGSATPIAWGELYTALQQGVVDGAENNPPSFWSSKHFEVAKYYTLDEHTMVPDIILISQYTWDHLNPQQQGWLQSAMDESVVYQRKLWAEATEEALEAVAAAGVEIIRPNKAPYQQKVQSAAASAAQNQPQINKDIINNIKLLRK